MKNQLTKIAQNTAGMLIALTLATAAHAQEKGLVLNPAWQMQFRDTRYSEDLVRLLKPLATAKLDLAVPSSVISLYGPITYLMPFPQAQQLLRGRIYSSWQLHCTAFPSKSFTYHAFDGQFGDGFNKLILVCDRAMQVVAVELVDEAPRREPSMAGSTEWCVYDFIQSGTKGCNTWRIGHRVAEAGGTIQIDSELIDPIIPVVRGHSRRVRYNVPTVAAAPVVYGAAYGDATVVGGKLRERVRLYLAGPVASVILYNAR